MAGLKRSGLMSGGPRQLIAKNTGTVTNASVPAKPCRLSDTDGIFLYNDAATGLRARHFSVNPTTYAFTVGAECSIRAGLHPSEAMNKCLRLSATTAMWIAQPSAGKCYAGVLTNSGGTLTASTEALVNASATVLEVGACVLDATHVLLCQRDGSDVKLRVLVESGGTITPGAEVTLTDANNNRGALAALSSTKALLLTGAGNAFVITTSGNTVSNVSAATVVSGITDARYMDGAALNANTAIFSFNETTSPHTTVAILTENGGTITAGAATNVITQTQDTANSYGTCIDKITSKRALVGTLGIKSAGSDQGFFAEVLGVSGLTPNETLGTELFETGESWGGSFDFAAVMSQGLAVMLGNGNTCYSWQIV